MVVQLVSQRRDFLKLLTCGAVGGSLTQLSFGQGTRLKAVKLADNVVEITGAGSNVLAVMSADGVLMVDGGSAEHSAELLKLIAEQSHGLPVKVLFDTHWHAEQTGSNQAVRKMGAKVIAHENTKLWMGAEVIVEWQKRTVPPSPAEALPNQTFYTTGKLTFGDENVQYGYLGQAHTDTDIYVFLPKSNVLMAGDVVAVGHYPILDYSSGGWIGGITAAVKTLLTVANAETRIVPSDGPVQTRAELEEYQKMLSTVMDRLVKLIRQGAGAKDMIAAAPTKEFDAKYGNPELFITNAYPGMWGHVRELGGIV